MTIRAFERIILRLELVRRQKISRKLMRILPPFDFGERCRFAAVFGMTGAALRRRVNGVHAPVRRHQILHLKGDILMTDDTAIIHRLCLPRGGVTGAARTGNFGMGMNAAQHIAGNGIERPRAKHLSAAGNGKARNGKSRDKGGEDTSKRKTTQAGASHSPRSFLSGHFKNVA